MDTLTLKVTEKTYATAKDARKADRVPMAYYGKGVENRSFSADYQSFRKVLDKGGKSTIINLVTEENKEWPILIHDIQLDPVSERFVHVDVLAVDMKKTLQTHIQLVPTGVSLAVKDLGGILVQNRGSVLVECLPKDLVHQIEVDIAPIVDFHTSIRVSDIKVPGGIRVLDPLHLTVFTVTPPRSAIEEEAAAAAAATVAAEAAAAEAAKPAPGIKAAPGAMSSDKAPEKAEKGKEKK